MTKKLSFAYTVMLWPAGLSIQVWYRDGIGSIGNDLTSLSCLVAMLLLALPLGTHVYIKSLPGRKDVWCGISKVCSSRGP